ncbi:MAG: DUF1684 domain-containing protein [Calditrichaceae bacterium]
MRSFLGFLPIIIFLYACSNQSSNSNYSQAEIDSLKNEFVRYCQNKDKDFKNTDWSPLTKEDKSTFSGLHYYSYDISFRYQLKIHTYSTKDTIKVPGSKAGDLRKAVLYGYFEFERDGKSQRLEVWQMMPRKAGGESHLFVGFWDATSGETTYPGGRYLDMKKIDDKTYLLDFNYAYNPYCAYSNRYSCLIPSLENRLDIALTCGEKIFKEH